MLIKLVARKRRRGRVRARLEGKKDRPRISVFRSHKHIYAQLIDDETGRTIAASTDLDVTLKNVKKSDLSGLTPTRNLLRAFRVGEDLAKKAKKQGITKAVFDTSFYLYHGQVKALAEGARSGGLKF